MKSICFGDQTRCGTSYGYDELDLDYYSNLTTDKLDYYCICWCWSGGVGERRLTDHLFDAVAFSIASSRWFCSTRGRLPATVAWTCRVRDWADRQKFLCFKVDTWTLTLLCELVQIHRWRLETVWTHLEWLCHSRQPVTQVRFQCHRIQHPGGMGAEIERIQFWLHVCPCSMHFCMFSPSSYNVLECPIMLASSPHWNIILHHVHLWNPNKSKQQELCREVGIGPLPNEEGREGTAMDWLYWFCVKLQVWSCSLWSPVHGFAH